MSGYQQRWRNVYINGSLLQGDVAVGSRQMTVNFHCQVSSRSPRSARSSWYSPHAVRSCCWGGSSVQHIPLNWHAAYAWVLKQETALLFENVTAFSPELPRTAGQARINSPFVQYNRWVRCFVRQFLLICCTNGSQKFCEGSRRSRASCRILSVQN